VAQKEPLAKNWLAAAQALEKVGNVNQAKSAYNKVMELDPNNSQAENALLKLAVDSLGPKRQKRK
jgi:Flp pilus assembly protein TadD